MFHAWIKKIRRPYPQDILSREHDDGHDLEDRKERVIFFRDVLERLENDRDHAQNDECHNTEVEDATRAVSGLGFIYDVKDPFLHGLSLIRSICYKTACKVDNSRQFFRSQIENDFDVGCPNNHVADSVVERANRTHCPRIK